MRSFHIDCGNSTTGPVGFCAVVRAKSCKEALEILKRALPEVIRASPCGDSKDNGAVEYIQFYTNAEKVKIRDVDGGGTDPQKERK